MNNDITLWFVTTLYIQDVDKSPIRERTPGFFLTEQEAIDCITNNYGDIYECSEYNYAVIYVKKPGLYNSLSYIKWFKVTWLGVTEQYPTGEYEVKECEPPSLFHKQCHFCGVG